MRSQTPDWVRLRVQRCEQPLADEILLEEATGLLDDEEARRVREHLMFCWSCGLRSQKARAWLAARKAEVCPRARELFDGYYRGTLRHDQMAWLEAHRLVCTDCWDAYAAYLEAVEAESAGEIAHPRRSWTVILGELTGFSRLAPVQAAEEAVLAYAAAPVAPSDAEAPGDIQGFSTAGMRVYVVRDERGHIVAQVLRNDEPVRPLVVELAEETGQGTRVRYAAGTNEAGIADFGPLSDLAAPMHRPYVVQVRAGDDRIAGESLSMASQTPQKTLYEREPGLKELEEKGLIRPPLREKRQLPRPPQLPGKPLSEYLDEVRGERSSM